MPGITQRLQIYTCEGARVRSSHRLNLEQVSKGSDRGQFNRVLFRAAARKRKGPYRSLTTKAALEPGRSVSAPSRAILLVPGMWECIYSAMQYKIFCSWTSGVANRTPESPYDIPLLSAHYDCCFLQQKWTGSSS